jgi:hypothetical protein
MTNGNFNYRVFFDPATGRINGYEQTNTPSTREGQDHIDFDHPVDAHHLTHKVDLATRAIVEMTPDEKYKAQLPAEHEVKAAIYRELETTDSLFAPGRPLENSEAWLVYRQALRDLSKQGLSHLDQLRAWPQRPDQRDSIAYLRNRMKG